LPLPVIVVLDNVRSLYNTGAFFRTADACGLERLLLCVFGHEVEGVSASIAGEIATHVRIPMMGDKRSLNVATAGGVVLFEVLRRRLEMDGTSC